VNRLLLAAPLIVIACPAAAQEAPRAAIEAAMLDSAEGWNSGNLDRFLAVYSDDPATSFTTDKGVARGKAGIRAQYEAGYPEQFGPNRAARPLALSFTFEDFRLIGTGHALLIAQWKLVTDGDEKGAKTGTTSLLFRKEAGGWRIIADHSS
jgi:uncharacterized protein (TIGR02246 family)